MRNMDMFRIKTIAILLIAFAASQHKAWGQLEISTAEGLANFASVVNGGTSYKGNTVTLKTDIVLSSDWTPIGTSSRPFEGTFDGGSHTISGLQITGGTQDDAGLFGYCSGATIKNLTVAATTIAGDENVGILAGSLISSSITGCSVSATSISGTRNVSALVGYRDEVTESGCSITGTTVVSLSSSSDLTASNLNKPCNLTLTGRTLYKDGKWNTICLPFDYDPAYGVLSGDGVEVYTITDPTSGKGAYITDNRLILLWGTNIAGNGVMRAGVPYIIKWTSGSNLVNPLFTGVVPRVTTTADYNNEASGDAQVRFCGTFDLKTVSTKDQSILFMGNNNTLYYPDGNADTRIGAFRAYFKIGNGASARQLSDFDFNFGEGETTGILLNTNLTDKTGAWYSISGVRLNGIPTVKGLYIHNGRKEVIK